MFPLKVPSCLLLVVNIAFGENMLYLSNAKFGPVVWGEESKIVDYVTLANDQVGNLPNSFTICSSYFMKFVQSSHQVIEMLKQDGSPWFTLAIETGQRNTNTFSETVKLWLPPKGSYTSYHQDLFREAPDMVPIIPNSWYHVCMGLDTVSGLLRIAVNGRLVVNEEKDYFEYTTDWKPTSVAEKILIFKGYLGGFWYQYRGSFSNMNIFSSLMSVEDMVARTLGGDTCDTPGDYLRYH